MINFSAFENARIRSEPFPYTVLENLIDREDVESLLLTLPQAASQRVSRQEGSDKTYSNITTVLLELGSKEYNKQDTLDAKWLTFLDIINSREYRISCSKIFGLDLVDCHPEITIRKYRYKDYISAHTDRDCVYATQLIFLNTVWEESWGGILHFMKDKDNDHSKFIPHFSKSIMFLRTDTSWHRVSEVTRLGVERVALQIAFWKTLDKVVYKGREISVDHM